MMTTQLIRIYVLDVPEFSALIRVARTYPYCNVTAALPGYTVIESQQPIEFRRKELGLKPAIWYGLFTGGLQGHIETFDRDIVRIVAST